MKWSARNEFFKYLAGATQHIDPSGRDRLSVKIFKLISFIEPIDDRIRDALQILYRIVHVLSPHLVIHIEEGEDCSEENREN